MPKYLCKRCNKKYEAMTPEGFCNNQPDCEYGSGWLSEVKDGDTGAEASSAAPAIRFDNEAGLCVLMMDGSLSMGDLAFPKTDYPGTKYRLVSTNAAGGIWSLKSMTHADNAHIALCVFGGKPELVWIKSVKDIVGEYGTQEDFANYIHDVLQKQTPEPKVTNIATAVKLAYDIYAAYLAGNLSPFGGIADFRPLIHKVVKQSADGENFIDIPNGRVLIYTDGEHNVVDIVKNPFAGEAQSVLLSAFIGEEDSPGIRQMQRIANECPRHSPSKGFFLIDSPERIQTLKGLFRMASGASGFCPICLMMERPQEARTETRENLQPTTDTQTGATA